MKALRWLLLALCIAGPVQAGGVGWTPGTVVTSPAPAIVAVRVGTGLQAIVNATPAGGVLQLDAGTFYADPTSPSTPLTIPDAISIVGLSTVATIIASPILVANDQVRLSDFTARCAGAAYGIKIYRSGSSATRATLERLWIGASASGAGDGPVVGLWLEDSYLDVINHCVISFNTGDGVYLHASGIGTNANRFEVCTMNGNGTGGVGYGVDIVGGSIEGTEIVGGNMQDNVTGELLASATTNLTIRGVDFERLTGCTNMINIATSNPVLIDDCNFLGNASVTRAFSMSSCTAPQVRGCRFSGFPVKTAIGIFDQNSALAKEWANVFIDSTYISPRGSGSVGYDPELKTAWQPTLARFNGVLWEPNAAGTGSGFGPSWSAGTAGTIALATPNNDHGGGWLRRTTFTSTANNQLLGPAITAATDCSFWTGDAAGFGGFYFAATFRMETWASNAGRIFVGLASNAAGNVASFDLAGILAGDIVGLYHETTDGANALYVMTSHAGVSGKTALTAGTTLASGEAFRFEMRCPPGQGGLVSCTLTSLKTGGVVGWAQAVTPSATAFMAPQCQITPATTGSVFAFGVANVYVTSSGR